MTKKRIKPKRKVEIKQSGVEGVVPVLVKAIAILEFIFSVLMIFIGVIFITGASFASQLADSLGNSTYVGAGVLVVLGIVFILLGIVGLFVGRGLWKGQGWARIFVLVFSFLGVFAGIGGLTNGAFAMGIFYLVLYGLLIAYFMFNERVKRAFS